MQGTEGDARSPLRHGMSMGTMPCRSGDLASPVCPTRIVPVKFVPMGQAPPSVYWGPYTDVDGGTLT
jgi:hypothetical protein